MVDAGNILSGESPYFNPVLLVKKKDVGTRFCVVYWELIELLRPTNFRFP